MITLYDTLYTNTDIWPIRSNSQTLDVDISTPGKYISSYYDMNTEYVFQGDWYSILQEWIWEMFVDSETIPWKVFVFALNTAATIDLKDSETWELYTSIYLYPHMYAEFTPSRGRFVKWADMIRIDTVFNIGYVYESLKNGKMDTISQRYLDSDDTFFAQTLQRIKNLQASSRKILESFKDQEIEILDSYEIAWRYTSLFVNDAKKIVILKNRILKYIVTILNSQKIDESIITKTLVEIWKLKELDGQEYEEIDFLIKNLMYLNNSDTQVDTSVSKLMLSSLIYNNLSTEQENFLLFAFSIFSNYDATWFFNINFFDIFLSSFSTFRPVEEDVSIIWNSEYQYFSYFLEKNISALILDDTSEINIVFINNILKKHINNWTVSYDASIVSRISGLYVYAQMLQEIDIFLRQKYFFPERDDIGLLRINPSEAYDVLQMTELSKQIQDIFIIFERNEKFLDDADLRDTAIKKDFKFYRKKLEEYFAALESYDLYVTKYDTLQQKIISIDTINQKQEDLRVLSQQEIQSYLSRFRWLDISRSQVSIINDRYYSIDNVKISGKTFSFDIYPFDDFRLTNIVVDNVLQNVQYKLSTIEENLKNSPWATSEDDINGFEWFFINTFFRTSSNTNIEEYVEQEVKQSENKAEIVFKRDKLLGINGEFADILSFLPISYGDISLVRKNNTYDIFIDDTTIYLAGIDMIFSAQYFLNQIDHHFIDIRLINNESFPRLQLKITGKVGIQDIETVLWDITRVVSNISWITSILESLWNTPNILYVTYSPYNKKTSIKFDLRGENYTMWITDAEIESLYRGTDQLITRPIQPSQLENFLP